MSACLDLEIGATVDTLMDLWARSVPEPIGWIYLPYSHVEVGGDGRSRGFGFPTASWIWDVLSQDQLNVFFDFFAADTDASVQLYIWTYKDVGRGLGVMLGRYQAIMHRPVDGAGKTLYPQSRTPIYNDVTINFTHLVSV